MSKHDLPSRGYRQLASAYAELEPRRLWPDDPVLDAPTGDIVTAVRHDDDPTLRALIVRIQAGDHAAGVVAVWALHERLRAIVHSTVRYDTDRLAMFDDHLTIAWWVLHDADPRHRSLADRVLSRTWRRYDRLYTRQAPGDGEEIPEVVSTDDPTAERVIARGELRRLVDTVEAGRLSVNEWRAVLAYRIDGEDDGRPMTPAARRQIVCRAMAKLRDFTAA